mgnify:FL=1
MSDTMKTRYEIELSIEGADRLNGQVDNIDRALEAISKNAKSLKFDEALQGVQALENTMRELSESEEDCTEQWKAFDRASSKTYADLEREAVRLNHSISEQGRLQRERLKELEQEKSALGSTKEEKARAREIDKEIASIRKQVVVASDAELKRMQKANVNARARLKLLQQESKAQKDQGKQQKTLLQLIKEDLKPLQERLRLQKEFLASLKSQEGRYLALKRVAKGAMSVGGAALKGAGVVAGGLMAIGGMAVASANKFVDREREADRLKISGSRKDKVAIIGDLYAKTGADDTSIVDAINRVYTVLGNISRDEIIEAATAEIRMPGAAALFRQQNTNPVSAKDFTAYFNRLRGIQGATGATREQITSSSDYIANLRQSSFTNASETDLQSLYLALQNSGAFDTDEELQRAFTSFVRKQKDSGVDVFTLAKQWQDNGNWTRTAEGNTNKTQAANAIKNLDFARIGELSKTLDYQAPEETASEKTARQMRQLETLKDKLLLEVLQSLQETLKEGDLKALISGALDLIKLLVKFLTPVIQKLLPYIDKFIRFIIERIGALAEYTAAIKEQNKKQAERQVEAAQSKSTAATIAYRGGLDHAMKFANGGITSLPSICGEAGFPEAVIPLDPSRSGRAAQIMQQVSQTFNMGSNESNVMSMASALRSSSWAYESGRISALSRRRGF